MKLTLSILFCIILTLQYNGADGELKLFGRIHESLNKAKQDVHNFFHPNEEKQQENNDASSNIHSLQYNGADGELKLFRRIQESLIKAKQDVHNLFHPNEEKLQENNDASSNIHLKEESEADFAAAAAARKPVQVTPAPAASTTTLAPTTTTAKNGTDDNGRENFAGGCVPGYKRTVDGRCKPEFSTTSLL